MEHLDKKRTDRLNAILIQLQTKRIITSTALAKQFGVSIRTVYRDIKALELAGVPILTEEGKGYTLMEGYKIPPVMFTERQANALILAEQLVLKNKDASLIRDYSGAIDKIKAVLRQTEKDKANLLSDRTRFKNITHFPRSSDSLSEMQNALTNFNKVIINYTNKEGKRSSRTVEPFAFLNTLETWLLIAYCHSRKDFRFFRLDRINQYQVLSEKFKSHKMTLEDFMEKYGHS